MKESINNEENQKQKYFKLCNKLLTSIIKHKKYESFDKCMETFEKIILICKKQENFEIAKVIKNTLNKLERIENE